MRELPISGPDEFSLFSFDMTHEVVDQLPDTSTSPPKGDTGADDEFDDIGGAAPRAAELSERRRSDYFLTVKEALNLQFAVGGGAATGQQLVFVRDASRSKMVNEGGKEALQL